MPYFGLRFGVYDILRRWHAVIADGEPIASQFSAAYGFASGFVASGLTFPMEVVRRRAMVGGLVRLTTASASLTPSARPSSTCARTPER